MTALNRLGDESTNSTQRCRAPARVDHRARGVGVGHASVDVRVWIDDRALDNDETRALPMPFMWHENVDLAVAGCRPEAGLQEGGRP